jgi:meiotically up-regulated gene 157 (Mug157) protein
MTWSAFRPSDEPTDFGYNIPGNMFAVVCLEKLEEILGLNF